MAGLWSARPSSSQADFIQRIASVSGARSCFWSRARTRQIPDSRLAVRTRHGLNCVPRLATSRQPRQEASTGENAAMITLTTKDLLPEDGTRGALVGRVWLPQSMGPAVVAVREDGVFDVTARFPTVTALCEEDDPANALRAAEGERIGDLESVAGNTPPDRRDRGKPWLLAPLDLQVLKAAGVTFAISMLERVIEERARGNPASADAIRKEVARLVGDDFSKLKPGSAEAMRLKQVLIEQGAWSQYLEVGIGPDAEVFTKAPVLSSVGTGMDAGLHPKSTWNNPEPEVVL